MDNSKNGLGMREFLDVMTDMGGESNRIINGRRFEFLMVFASGVWIASFCAVMYGLHIHYLGMYPTDSQVKESRDFWGGVLLLPLLLGWMFVTFLGVSPLFGGQGFQSWLFRSKSRGARALTAFALGFVLAAVMAILPLNLLGMGF